MKDLSNSDLYLIYRFYECFVEMLDLTQGKDADSINNKANGEYLNLSIFADAALAKSSELSNMAVGVPLPSSLLEYSDKEHWQSVRPEIMKFIAKVKRQYILSDQSSVDFESFQQRIDEMVDKAIKLAQTAPDVAYELRYNTDDDQLILNGKPIKEFYLSGISRELIRSAFEKPNQYVDKDSKIDGSTFTKGTKVPKELRPLFFTWEPKRFKVTPIITQQMIKESGIDTRRVNAEINNLKCR